MKQAPSSGGQVAAAEVVFTLVLAFILLAIATVKNALIEHLGCATGMCVAVGGCAIGKVSGGSLNPAVSFVIPTLHILKDGGF